MNTDAPIPPAIAPVSPVVTNNPDTLIPWLDPVSNRHNIRVICDLEGMTEQQKNDFSRTVHCESNYDNSIVMFNCENGFVRSTAYNEVVHGAILSKDVGLFQINTYWHIGAGKDFPSEEYVLQNPEACARWAAKVFKQTPNTWVCHSKGMYLHYSS